MPKLFFSGALAPGPLRELPFDDNDAGFWTFQGWNLFTGGGWPGGLRQNTMHYCDNVQPGQSVQVATRRFFTTGTVEEGLAVYLATEGGGPLQVWLDGQLLTTLYGLGYYNALQQYSYDLRRQGYDSGSLAQGNGQAPFTDTPTFGPGWHTVSFVKVVNAAAGNGDSGGRRTYFDGGTIYTRDASFS